MMLRTLLIFILTACCHFISGQQAFIGFGSGLGTYAMKDLDRFQEIRRQSTGLPLETTESYPATLGYHFEVGQYMNAFISKWGLIYTYRSTGARSTISDYSGRFDLDAVISAHNLGLSLEHNIKQKKNWTFGVYMDAGVVFTELTTLDFFNLVYPGHTTYKIKYDMVTSGGFVEPGISLNYKYRFLMGSLKIGYMNDFSAVFHEKDFKERQFYLNNKKVKPGWDGFRACLQINILFRNTNKQAL